MSQKVIILSIETSCDETSIAILENGNQILAHLVSSQMKTHSKYGGVVPEIASRQHTECIHKLIGQCLEKAKLTVQELNAIAVTVGPGLEGSLLIGFVVAKTMATLLNIPLIPVNHLHGHIYASFLEDPSPVFPFTALIVSGGHTQIIHVKDHFEMTLIGQTRDDAAGEAFDKVARCLDLGYPGGPVVEKLANEGNPAAFNFPRPMLNDGFEFSFSGLKTAVIQAVNKLKTENNPLPVADISASFQQAVIDTLVTKTIKAVNSSSTSSLVLSGGVVANKTLITAFSKACDKNNIKLFYPKMSFCTDNAAMIGVVGYYAFKNNITIPGTIKSNLPICN